MRAREMRRENERGRRGVEWRGGGGRFVPWWISALTQQRKKNKSENVNRKGIDGVDGGCVTGTGCSGRFSSRLPVWPFGACTNVAGLTPNDLFPICSSVSTVWIVYIIYIIYARVSRPHVKHPKSAHVNKCRIFSAPLCWRREARFIRADIC